MAVAKFLHAFPGLLSTSGLKRWSTAAPAASKSGNPRRNAAFELRKRLFLEFIDPAATRGLEIGALDLPMIEPHEGRCDFADYHSTEEVKGIAAQHPDTNPDFVPNIDYVVADGYDAVPRDYDWIAAANVLEHIADPIGWLRTMSDHLKPGGILFLALPDKTYTFDVHRNLTTFSELVAWHQAGLKRPSFQQVFDFVYNFAPRHTVYDIWKGKLPSPPSKGFAAAMEAARISDTLSHQVHCSVFTPESFVALMREIKEAGLIGYQVISVRPPARKTLEFFAVLRRGA
jgi:SAM-dependent methyltransferase